MNKEIKLKDFTISNKSPFVLFGGINVLEDSKFNLEVAQEYKNICDHLKIPLVFKASYDKANRSSIKSARGPGIEKGIEKLSEIKNMCNIPILTDVHTPDEAKIASVICDIIQLPAFLSRQTDLIKAMANTGSIINIKKAQFLSPTQMKNIVNKFCECGNEKIILCERGTNFGYDNLIVDMLGFGVMKKHCNDIPVIFDVTHSLQCRADGSVASSGRRSQVLDLAKSGIAQKLSGLFLESHPDPLNALCDGPSALPLKHLKNFLFQLKQIDDIVKKQKEIVIN